MLFGVVMGQRRSRYGRLVLHCTGDLLRLSVRALAPPPGPPPSPGRNWPRVLEALSWAQAAGTAHDQVCVPLGPRSSCQTRVAVEPPAFRTLVQGLVKLLASRDSF